MKRLAVAAITVAVVALLIMPRTKEAEGAAPTLSVWAQDCSWAQPGTIRVTFRWTPSHAGPQWLDLSLADNDFAQGTFIGAGPLAPESYEAVWDGLLPSTTHYARVNTLHGGTWEPGVTHTFTTGTCGQGSPTSMVQQSCPLAGPFVNVTFNWSPSLLEGGQQWLDLSLSDNGFAPGTFLSAGPLSRSDSSLGWPGLRQGVVHYWRVNTFTSHGWVPSDTRSFETSFCNVGAAPIPGATYKGTTSQGWPFEFTVSNDGARITRLFYGWTASCPRGGTLQTAVATVGLSPGVEIIDGSFSYASSSQSLGFSGRFTSPTSAEGYANFWEPVNWCASGRVTWAAYVQ